MTRKDAVEKNMTSMIQLLGGLVKAANGIDQTDVALFITNDLC